MGSTDSETSYSHTYYEPPKTFVKSAMRVLNVLEYFYRNRHPARAVDISRTLDLPVSSTKYLLTSLVDSGYMTFDKESKKYFPSILFTGFASWLSGIYPSGEILRKLARETHDQLGETISVTVQHEQHMRALIIEMDNTATPPAYDFRVRIPLVGSGGGLIALATLSDEEVIDCINRESGKLPPDRRQSRYDQILSDVRQARQRGYSVKQHTVSLDGQSEILTVIAVPIPVADKAPPMVLAISTTNPDHRGRETELAAAMKNIVEKYRELL